MSEKKYFHDKMQIVNKKVISNKAKHVMIENELKKAAR